MPRILFLQVIALLWRSRFSNVKDEFITHKNDHMAFTSIVAFSAKQTDISKFEKILHRNMNLRLRWLTVFVIQGRFIVFFFSAEATELLV